MSERSGRSDTREGAWPVPENVCETCGQPLPRDGGALGNFLRKDANSMTQPLRQSAEGFVPTSAQIAEVARIIAKIVFHGNPGEIERQAATQILAYVQTQLAAPLPPTQESFGPWRIMTPEEYAALTLKGRHTVERDFDGFGNVAVWLSGHVPPPTQEQELATFHNRLRKMLNIDFGQLVDAGVMSWDDNSDWVEFQNNSWLWFIRASDEDAAKVWAIMWRIEVSPHRVPPTSGDRELIAEAKAVRDVDLEEGDVDVLDLLSRLADRLSALVGQPREVK